MYTKRMMSSHFPTLLATACYSNILSCFLICKNDLKQRVSLGQTFSTTWTVVLRTRRRRISCTSCEQLPRSIKHALVLSQQQSHSAGHYCLPAAAAALIIKLENDGLLFANQHFAFSYYYFLILQRTSIEPFIQGCAFISVFWRRFLLNERTQPWIKWEAHISLLH